MLKTILFVLLPFLALFSNGSNYSLSELGQKGPTNDSGTLEKMIAANGDVEMKLDIGRLSGKSSGTSSLRTSTLRFGVERNSFFTTIVFNNELRAILPSTMPIVPQDSAPVSGKLNASYQNLVIENLPIGGPYELAVRDGNNGFTFFNIEGFELDYDFSKRLLTIKSGRLLISEEYASELGRPSSAGTIVGEVSISTTMRAIEVTEVIDGEPTSNKLPPSNDPLAGTRPGPDVVVGDLTGLAQFGSSSGTQVGLAIGTDSCNFGTVDLNWFANPQNDHPVIPQNLYRMSGGATNDERFEQIGQSSVKHAFTALTQNLCALGCNGTGGSRLGSGCSDPYSASLNSGPSLGSRAWINPFSGEFPRNDSATPNNSHSGHTHLGPSHRVLTEINDLNTSLNSGATYYAEGQYITPHEYAWCQSNPTQCNMYNNVSYRRYNVSGTGSPFSFSPVGATVREKAAIQAWGATTAPIDPAPGVDGVGLVAYKVTNSAPGVWHYEYAVYNQNIDRGIQSFSIPVGNGVTLTNVGFHAPPQHPGWSGDGTVGNAGFSSTPWAQSQAAGAMTWNSETFAQNPNANAIRWGTMYNFRFDSNRPPQPATATIGFFKTGSPITAQVEGPSPATTTSVSVSGRVSTSNGRGLGRASVSMTDSMGVTRMAITNPFGYYRFDNVTTGGSYTFGVLAKGFTIASQTITVNDNISNMDFAAGPAQ